MNEDPVNRRKFLGLGGAFGGVVGLSTLTGCLPAEGASAVSLATASESSSTNSFDVFNVRTYGAIGDGSADDTVAIQSTITAAQIKGGIVFFPAGSYKISAQLNITGRLTMTGVGYQGEEGLYYRAYGSPITRTNGWRASVLVCGTNHNALFVATNDAVTIENLQITYPTAPSAGVAGIVGDAGSGPNEANTYSSIRNVMISGADIGIVIKNWFDFLIENVKVFGSAKISISIAPSNYPSFGDSTITNCSLVSPFVEAHLLVKSGGGLRVVNNKFNASKIGGYGILVEPFANNTHALEPFIVANNSFEAQCTAVAFFQQNTTAYINQILINNNQMWIDAATAYGGSLPASGIAVAGSAGWCSAMVICGNVILLSPGGFCVNLTGASNVLISGNLFQCSSLSATATAVYAGPNTSNIRQTANLANAGCIYTGT